MFAATLEDRPKPAVQRFEVPVERDLTGDELYAAKKRFRARGWCLNWVWYRRTDQGLICLLYCVGVTDRTDLADLLLGS